MPPSITAEQMQGKDQEGRVTLKFPFPKTYLRASVFSVL